MEKANFIWKFHINFPLLPTLCVNTFNGFGCSDADIAPLTNGALIAWFFWMELNGFNRFRTISAIKGNVASFGIEVLPLLSERRNVNKIVV